MPGVFIQGMAMPEFRGKLMDFGKARMRGARACSNFPSKEASAAGGFCRSARGRLRGGSACA
jgi:hypothetical protein